MRWTVEQVAGAVGAVPPQGVAPLAGLAGVSIDSRTIRPGELFLAIHGPRHDGHAFVASALASGALAGVVERARLAEYPAVVREKLFAVEGTLDALQRLARAVRREWGGPMAAVTGSTGKTTTKEILAALVGARRRVLRTSGNQNNEYGLPLTLLQLDPSEHEAAVVELGMSHRGEIAQLCRIAEPEVGIVTNIAPVHLEFFSSVDEIALAKRELIEGLVGSEPVAVLNADDERVSRLAEGFRGRVLTFGLGPSAHSGIGPVRQWNLREYTAWARAVQLNEAPVAGREALDDDAVRLETLYLGLRTREGVPKAMVSDGDARQWIAEGWATAAGQGLVLTPEGWLRLDALVGTISSRDPSIRSG